MHESHSSSTAREIGCACGHDHGHSHTASCGCEHDHAHPKADHKDRITLIAGTLLYLGLIIIHQVTGGDYPLPMILGFVCAYFILGGEVVWTAIKNLFSGHVFDENFLMSIAILGAFAIAQYPEAVGVMLFFRIGEAFEDYAVGRSRSQIMDAVDLRPEVVNRVTGDTVQVIAAKEARVGDILMVRPGDRIPLDGTVVDGETRLDTSAVTGEPVPVRAVRGDAVISGCVNTTGVIRIRVTNVLADSMVSRILNSVENAAASKPHIDAFITRFARIYTPVVVGIAVLTAVGMPLVTGQSFYPWVYTALSFLVMSCPCALVLSVPLAFFCGIGSGSRQGILFKGGVVMETLATIKAVVMDKTGTITEGNFTVQRLNPVSGGPSEETLLALCAACEQGSTHPIGTSISAAAKAKNLDVSRPEKITELSGKGISAVLKGQSLLCGNLQLMEHFSVDCSRYQKSDQGSEVLLAVDGRYAGSIVIADTLKTEAPGAIARLRRENLVTAMLTGDTADSARAIARKAGIEDVHARLLPEEKLETLKNIRQTHGPVLFVGDGINDAPVLAGADVGAAMGSGADAALEAADVVYMRSDMNAIPESIALSRHTRRIALQNVIFALTIKIAVMILGITGIYANLWLAVFADTGVAFLCILNAMRLLLYKQPARFQ